MQRVQVARRNFAKRTKANERKEERTEIEKKISKTTEKKAVDYVAGGDWAQENGRSEELRG